MNTLDDFFPNRRTDRLERWLPTRWYVPKQGEWSPECGPYALMTISHAMNHLEADKNWNEWCLSTTVGRSSTAKGTFPAKMNELADNLGLALTAVSVDQACSMPAAQHLSRGPIPKILALVRWSYCHPDAVDRDDCAHGHYVAVFGGDGERVVVADPHPWAPRVYWVTRAEFVEGCERARPYHKLPAPWVMQVSLKPTGPAL